MTDVGRPRQRNRRHLITPAPADHHPGIEQPPQPPDGECTLGATRDATANPSLAAVDIDTMRRSISRFIGPDALPPTGDTLTLLHSLLRVHMQLLIPRSNTPPCSGMRTTCPRYVALACTDQAQTRRARAHHSPRRQPTAHLAASDTAAAVRPPTPPSYAARGDPGAAFQEEWVSVSHCLP
ncbi:DUF6415 family natural product biosynthesis protein [Streptomyces sp. NPDC047043]|uniref:DUF6415 family natural product biosynthesis protein n=1 Tax=Streptomyces sp. NPDC047043 TaxID=3154497 RepID=UPI0033C56C74